MIVIIPEDVSIKLVGIFGPLPMCAHVSSYAWNRALIEYKHEDGGIFEYSPIFLIYYKISDFVICPHTTERSLNRCVKYTLYLFSGFLFGISHSFDISCSNYHKKIRCQI